MVLTDSRVKMRPNYKQLEHIFIGESGTDLQVCMCSYKGEFGDTHFIVFDKHIATKYHPKYLQAARGFTTIKYNKKAVSLKYTLGNELVASGLKYNNSICNTVPWSKNWISKPYIV